MHTADLTGLQLDVYMTREVGSGRVGRTRALSLEERASLTARALIRRQYTSYEDDLNDAPIGDPWDEEFWYREIKTEAQRAVDDFLDHHRKAPGVDSVGVRTQLMGCRSGAPTSGPHAEASPRRTSPRGGRVCGPGVAQR